MTAKDPYKLSKGRQRLTNMREALDSLQHPPFIGVTQGGSSRKNSGARVAATTGLYKRPKYRRTKHA